MAITKIFRTLPNEKRQQSLVKQVLSRYAKPNFIEDEKDLDILKRYHSTGMVRYGFNYKLKKAEATLTRQGRWLLKQIS